jgi:hypothetical protein
VGFDAEGKERWDAVDYKGPIALVFGGEGKGIRRLVKEKCDHVVSLPLFGHVASLNVSVVAGIALYEVIRQRGVVPSHVRPIPLKRLHPPAADVGPGPEDQENDPGQRLHDSLDNGSHGATHEQGDDEDESVSVTGFHEDVAWAGPTVVGTTERRHGFRRDESRRPERRPDEAVRAVRDAGSADGSRALPESGGRHRRRRRGRRPQHGGPPQGAGGSQGAGGPAPQPRDSGQASDGTNRAGAGETPSSPSGGRRRRRRRRR